MKLRNGDKTAKKTGHPCGSPIYKYKKLYAADLCFTQIGSLFRLVNLLWAASDSASVGCSCKYCILVPVPIHI